MSDPICGDTFTNPVLKGFHPDPSICRVEDRFFLVVSSFEYFPGIPIYTSTDLVTWESLGHVLDRPGQLDLRGAPASGGIYAPTIRYHDGVFYVTATNVSGNGHFIVRTTDPAGEWSDPVWIDQNGIDPSLYFEDGRAYFASTVEPDVAGPHLATPEFRRGIQQSVIDATSGTRLTEPVFIWEGTGGRFPEGPHIYRRGRFYYLLLAEGGTEYGHMVTVGRSRSLWGPFEPSPYGPLVDHRSIASDFQAVGHADLVALPNGDWWLVCLGVRPVGQWPRHLLGRETLLAAVHWTDDWPRVGSRAAIDAVQPRPALQPAPARPAAARDDFEQTRLSSVWQTVRAPLRNHDALSARPGWLTLRPGPDRLGGQTPAFVGRRQEDYDFVARTAADLDSRGDGDLAGLCVRMNEQHFFAFGIRRSAHGWQIVLRQVIGHLALCTVLGEVACPQVTLTVEGDPDVYRFRAETPDGTVLSAAPVMTKFLSTELAGGFTGVLVGMFAESGAGGSAVSHFDWFEYSGAARRLGRTAVEPSSAAAGRTDEDDGLITA